MKNILITGGAGFIGSNFVRYILEKDPLAFVLNLDQLGYAGNLDNLQDLANNKNYKFVQGSIRDRRLIEELLGTYLIDTIINFASESHVDRSIRAPEEFVQTNVVGTQILLECARNWWVEKATWPLERVHFHHVSTDKVFGSLGPQDPPFAETNPYRPTCPYGAAKAAADHFVMAYWHTYGLPITISYSTNNYGPYQHPEKLIPLVILQALAGEPIPIYGDGLQVSDWLHVLDHCEALLTILLRGQIGERYNVATGEEASAFEVAKLVCSLLDERLPSSAQHGSLIRFIRNRLGQPRRQTLDFTKIHTSLGWLPRHKLLPGLHDTVDWYLDHQDWLNRAASRHSFKTWIQENYGPFLI